MINDFFHLIFSQSTCLCHSLYLHICTLRSNIRVETGGTRRYHLRRNIFTAQIGMMYKERIDTRFHFSQIFGIRGSFVAAGRTRSIITVSGTRRTSPEINIFCKHLTDIGRTHHFSIQCGNFSISLIRSCHLCKQPQNKNIEYGEKDTENKSYL